MAHPDSGFGPGQFQRVWPKLRCSWRIRTLDLDLDNFNPVAKPASKIESRRIFKFARVLFGWLPPAKKGKSLARAEFENLREFCLDGSRQQKKEKVGFPESRRGSTVPPKGLLSYRTYTHDAQTASKDISAIPAVSPGLHLTNELARECLP